MLQFIGQFLGPEEILDVKDTGTTTHRNVPILEITTRRVETEDKTRLTTITLNGLELVVSDQAQDWNYVQNTKLDHVVKQLVNVATDFGVDGSDLTPMLSRFGMALAVRFEHAAHLCFEGDDTEFVPGGNEFHTWSLAKAEHVIVNSKNGTTETTS